MNEEGLEYTGNPDYQPQPPPLGESKKRQRKCYPYRPEPGLVQAVNLAIALERPLLLQGDPGCGKTRLASAIAYEFSQRYLQGQEPWPYYCWNIKSTTRAQEGLYYYDAIARLRDAQFLGMNRLEDYLPSEEVKELIQRLQNRSAYLEYGCLGKAFLEKSHRPILLLDEIDKADIDFPNDLLLELEELRFEVPEIGAVGDKSIAAAYSPIVIVTSNREKELPDAFLRRCVYYFLNFPEEDELVEIVKLHFPNLESEQEQLVEAAIDQFLDIREIGVKRPESKRIGTSELLDWLRVLLNKPVPEALQNIRNLASNLPLLGTLLKTKDDQDHYQRESDE